MIFFIIFIIFIFGALGFGLSFLSEDITSLWSSDEDHKGPSGDHSKKFCSVCAAENCPRSRDHEVCFDHNQVCVTERISLALEELFDIIIERYVSIWYNNISLNEDFVVEIKLCIQFIMAAFLHRASRVDIPELVSSKVIPAFVNHIDICLELQKFETRGSASLDDVVLRRMDRHLHVTMATRHSELQYLRALVGTIMPHVLHRSVAHSSTILVFLNELLASIVLLPALDALANPDIVNKILLLCLDGKPAPDPLEPPSPTVPIMHTYLETWKTWLAKKPQPTKQMEDFLKDGKEFYPFLQYLKSIQTVGPFTFLTMVDEINKRLFQPDIPADDCLQIQKDLAELHKMVESDGDLIQLQLPADFRQVVLDASSGSKEKVASLSTCRTWLDAYGSACRILETVYLPDYFESEIYMKILHGNRHPSPLARATSSAQRKDFGLARLGSRLKGVLGGPMARQTSRQSSMVEGRALDDIVQGEEAALLFGVLDNDSVPSAPPDLSTWRVTIPSIAQPYFDSKRVGQFYFAVHTHRVDQEKPYTRVDRKYNEFYVLEQKLNEFHGDMQKQLSQKKQFAAKNVEFLDSKKHEFEDYLQFLLARPFLRHSELLYKFLSSPMEFNSSILPDINIGRFVKSVPMKFSKEKGQYLEAFLSSFHTSCEAAKPVSNDEASLTTGPSTPEPRTTSFLDTKLHARLFWNNAGRPLPDSKTVLEEMLSRPCGLVSRVISGFYDLADLLIERLGEGKPECLTALLRGLRPIVRPRVDRLAQDRLDTLLKQLMQEHRLVPIVHMLRDLLFFPTSHHRTDSDKQLRKEEAYATLLATFPKLLKHGCGEEKFNENCARLFDILQHPKWNKQLIFILLDILVVELFPDAVEDHDLPCSSDVH